MNIVKRLAACLLALLLLTGCSSRDEPRSREVALIAKSSESEFFKSVFSGARAAASEYNIRLTLESPATEEDVTGQNALIDAAVDRGVDAIVLSAVSYDGNAAAVDRAADEGVAVVVIDSDVNSRKVRVRIGTDNTEAGEKAAYALFQQPGDLVVGIVNYDTNSRNGQERERGFRLLAAQEDRVRRFYTINVLAQRVDARMQTRKLLQEHPEINALVAFNEPTCVGAAMAVEDLELQGKIRMVGFDSNVDAVDMMQSGAISALVVQNPYAMGYLGVEAAYRLLNGADYDPTALIKTPTLVLDQETMFTVEGQKALFSFH